MTDDAKVKDKMGAAEARSAKASILKSLRRPDPSEGIDWGDVEKYGSSSLTDLMVANRIYLDYISEGTLREGIGMLERLPNGDRMRGLQMLIAADGLLKRIQKDSPKIFEETKREIDSMISQGRGFQEIFDYAAVQQTHAVPFSRQEDRVKKLFETASELKYVREDFAGMIDNAYGDGNRNRTTFRLIMAVEACMAEVEQKAGDRFRQVYNEIADMIRRKRSSSEVMSYITQVHRDLIPLEDRNKRVEAMFGQAVELGYIQGYLKDASWERIEELPDNMKVNGLQELIVSNTLLTRLASRDKDKFEEVKIGMEEKLRRGVPLNDISIFIASYYADKVPMPQKESIFAQVRKRVEGEIEENFKRQKRAELDTVRYYPFRSLVKWIVAGTLAATLALGAVGVVGLKNFYEKIYNGRPAAVQIEDNSLPGLLLGIRGEQTQNAVLPDGYVPGEFQGLDYNVLASNGMAASAYSGIDNKLSPKQKIGELSKIVSSYPGSREAFQAEDEIIYIRYMNPSEFVPAQTVSMMQEFIQKYADSDQLSTHELNEIVRRFFNLSNKMNTTPAPDKATQATIDWISAQIDANQGTNAAYELSYILGEIYLPNAYDLQSIYKRDSTTVTSLDAVLARAAIDVSPEVLVETFVNSANGNELRASRGYAEAGKVMLQSGKNHAAINYLVKAMDHAKGIDFASTPWMDDTLYALGLAYQGIAEYENADNVFKALIERYPESPFVQDAK